MEAYIQKPQTTLGEARSQAKSLAERRAVEGLVRDVANLNSRLKMFGVDLAEAPNLTELRRALGTLIETAQVLETRIMDIHLSER